MEKLYSIFESADTLRVSIHSMRQWIYQKRIPVTRIGRRVFVKESVLDGIITNGLPEGIFTKKKRD